MVETNSDFLNVPNINLMTIGLTFSHIGEWKIDKYLFRKDLISVLFVNKTRITYLHMFIAVSQTSFCEQIS